MAFAIIFIYVKEKLSDKHFEALENILDNTLSAHKRAKWELDEARKMIIKVIIKKYREYLEVYL